MKFFLLSDVNFTRLPRNYKLIKKIDLTEDKKSAVIIRLLSILVVFVMFVFGVIFYGKNALEKLLMTEKVSELNYLIGKVLFIIFICFLYIQLREAVNIILMKIFCRKSKIKLNFKLFFTDAVSNAFFNRKAYIFISISPFLIFGLILGIIASFVPFEWFWTVYIVLIVNFASAAGDLYVLFIILRMPGKILIHDNGTEIEVFGLSKR